METDNVVYLLSSCLDDEIRRSMFARVRENVRACAYTCMCVLKLACACLHRGIDKLSVAPLSLSDRILMLIPMVNSPEMFHRKLIRPLSIIYTMAAFGHTHKAETLYVNVIHADRCLTSSHGI